VNGHLRAVESSSIDEGLRTRLEGDVELLEDALPLLESLRLAFGREEPGADDLDTFRECAGQLPGLDEALERVTKHEQATALTRAVGEKKRAAFEAGNARLTALKQVEQPSLRAVTEQVLEGSLRLGRAPQADELRLAGSSGYPTKLAFAFGTGGLAVSLVDPWLGLAAGAAVFFGTLLTIPRRAWELLPDRLYLPPSRKRPAAQRSLQDVRDVRLTQQGVEVLFDDETIHLRTAEHESTAALIQMLRSKKLGPLRSPAKPFVVLEGFDEETRLKGQVLVCGQGVLFVPHGHETTVCETLIGGSLPREVGLLGQQNVPFEKVLGLIAHVPAERANEVGTLVANGAGATWISRADVKVERSQVDTVHAVISGAGKNFRVKLSAIGKAAEWFGAASVLGKL
jgi:hypothetical protein